MKRTNSVLKIAIVICIFVSTMTLCSSKANCYSGNTVKIIRQYVDMQMKNSKIPGLAIAIVNGEETLLQEGFGIQDLKKDTLITDKTIFELGSNSKAFTALAILNLAYEGKINLNSDIKQYIPWLRFYYKNKEVRVNVENFIYHTSGVPSSTIYDIPVSSDNKAIENTVKAMNKNLEYLPYDKCIYATINYDILGLLIEKVTLMGYEEYIEHYILKPLKLSETYMYKEDVLTSLTPGYKFKFFKPVKYNAPEYKGNRPAGYIMSCASDMAKWLKWQINYEKNNTKMNKLIDMSHQIKSNNPPLSNNLFYVGGWIIDKDNSIILHSGSNPNFSSFIVIDPKTKIGISVLANMKSSYTSNIALGILDILNGKEVSSNITDFNQYIDKLASILIIFLIILLTILLYSIKRLAKKLSKFTYAKITRNSILLIIAGFTIAIIPNYYLFKLPMLFGMKNWGFINVWYPQTVIFTITLLATNFLSISMLLILFGLKRCSEYKKVDNNEL